MRGIIILVFFLLAKGAFGQGSVPSKVRATNTLDRLSDKGGIGRGDMLIGLAPPPGRIIGDTYLDNKWNKASMLLFDSERMIEGYPVKYDIQADVIEVMVKDEIKIIEGKKIKSMVWLDSVTNLPCYFVNGREYNIEGTALNGFLEVIVDGSLPLMKRTTITEKEPNYVPALDVGSRDKKILKKQTFFCSQNGGLTKIGNKKSLLPVFGDHSKDVESFIKANKLNVNKEAGLLKTFAYYNSKTLSTN
jgi:hypothetical protein